MPTRGVFGVEEYHRMAETGILGLDERVELGRSVVREMSPKNWAHVMASKFVDDLLRDALRGRGSVYQEAPLVIEGIDSEPEPDVLVCSDPDATTYPSARTKPLLIVEVADSSLGYDLGEKAFVYAEAGVPEYWVVNLIERTRVVFRKPEKESYQVRTELDASSPVTPAAWSDLSFQVSAFLPPSQSGEGPSHP